MSRMRPLSRRSSPFILILSAFARGGAVSQSLAGTSRPHQRIGLLAGQRYRLHQHFRSCEEDEQEICRWLLTTPAYCSALYLIQPILPSHLHLTQLAAWTFKRGCPHGLCFLPIKRDGISTMSAYLVASLWVFGSGEAKFQNES